MAKGLTMYYDGPCTKCGKDTPHGMWYKDRWFCLLHWLEITHDPDNERRHTDDNAH